MKIEHVAIWVKQLEKMKVFYEHYFGATASDLYHNPQKKLRTYFLTFEGETRLELMEKAENTGAPTTGTLGLTHLAFSVGSKEKVDEKTNQLINDGYVCEDGPRTTGDGYYESVVADPEGNRIEITI
ncbi:MAG: VOC family protein [Pisciglobus halotolerans]|nr:VOC family protein [Pisciglobus halotolerans]